jgi:hypothetical protein
MTPQPSKMRNGEFKCFRCRHTTPNKDGDWYPWKTMEVHLCRGCAKETEGASERKRSN